MKRLIWGVCVIVAVVVGMLVCNNISRSADEIALMDNVEALSSGEGEPGTGICYNSITKAPNCKVLYCGGCLWVEGMPDGEDKGYCN